jgi:hypothetical protein
MIENEFEAAMRNIYTRAASETPYRPTYLLRLISERGGVGAAHHLLTGPISPGFASLAELGRLDLSVEQLVLDPRWNALFEDGERAIARKRLGLPRLPAKS